MVIEILTLLSFVISSIRTRAPIRWHALNWAFLGFLCVLGFGVPVAVNNRYAYDTFEAMLITFIMFLIASNIVDSFDRLKKLIWMVLLVHTYFAIKGVLNLEVWNHWGGTHVTSGRVGSGFIGDENDFALALVTWIPTIFFAFMYLKDIRYKILSLFLLISFTWGVVSSQSRGGWVALVAAIAYCIASSRRKMLASCLAILAVLILFAVAPAGYIERLKTTAEVNKGTADERIRSWKAGFHMFLDHPFIGVGGANSGVHLPQYITGVANPGRMWGRVLHGTIPQVAAETGGIGLIFYFIMIIIAFGQLRAIRKQSAALHNSSELTFLTSATMGGIVAYLVGATFISTAYYPQLWLLLLLSVVISHLAECSGERDHLLRRDVPSSS